MAEVSIREDVINYLETCWASEDCRGIPEFSPLKKAYTIDDLLSRIKKGEEIPVRIYQIAAAKIESQRQQNI